MTFLSFIVKTFNNKNYRNAHLKETKNINGMLLNTNETLFIGCEKFRKPRSKDFLPIMETTKRKPMNFITELALFFPVIYLCFLI